jgi:hypothetical protein
MAEFHKCQVVRGQLKGICWGLYPGALRVCARSAADCWGCHHSSHFEHRLRPPVRRGSGINAAMQQLATQTAEAALEPSPMEKRSIWLAELDQQVGVQNIQLYDALRRQRPQLDLPGRPEPEALSRRAWTKKRKAYKEGLIKAGFLLRETISEEDALQGSVVPGIYEAPSPKFSL